MYDNIGTDELCEFVSECGPGSILFAYDEYDHVRLGTIYDMIWYDTMWYVMWCNVLI